MSCWRRSPEWWRRAGVVVVAHGLSPMGLALSRASRTRNGPRQQCYRWRWPRLDGAVLGWVQSWSRSRRRSRIRVPQRCRALPPRLEWLGWSCWRWHSMTVVRRDHRLVGVRQLSVVPRGGYARSVDQGWSVRWLSIVAEGCSKSSFVGLTSVDMFLRLVVPEWGLVCKFR